MELDFGNKEIVPKQKDWTGNRRTTFATLGASSHADHKREANDYYATEPAALEKAPFLHLLNNVWEPACGEGHLSKVLVEKGIHGKSSDLIARGYGEVQNFLTTKEPWNGSIVTNPPFKYAAQFVVKALSLVPDGEYVCMFLRIQFLESAERKSLFETMPPKYVYVASKRLQCGINGKFGGSSAACYAWFVWQKGYQGDIVLRLFN